MSRRSKSILNRRGPITIWAWRCARGAFHAAAASYRRAIAIKSSDPGSHSNLGNALRALGRHGEAEASHRRALALNADYLEARYNLGLVLKD